MGQASPTTWLRRSRRAHYGRVTDCRRSGCRCSLWVLGAIGAVVLIKLFNREWQRVNDELDRAKPARVNDPERAGVPTLRRDPATGEYRTER